MQQLPEQLQCTEPERAAQHMLSSVYTRVRVIPFSSCPPAKVFDR